MIISTWNLRHGGGSRIKDIIEVLKDNIQTDILVLTEFRNNSNKEILLSSLEKMGYAFFYMPKSEPKINTVFIATKKNYNVEYFEELKEHKQRVVKIKASNFSIYGCYFPQQKLKKEVFEFLLNQIQIYPNENIIITGDLNTGKHYLDEKGASFYCSEYFDKLEQKGMIDAWRLSYADNKEYSWYSNAGNGFRLDHFFISKSIKEKVTKCFYKHNYRERKISDHSFMSLEIKIEP